VRIQREYDGTLYINVTPEHTTIFWEVMWDGTWTPPLIEGPTWMGHYRQEQLPPNWVITTTPS
jgi:hypothetical protein